MKEDDVYFKGRGAQLNSASPFQRQSLVREHIEGLDEELLENSATKFLQEYPKKIINKVNSPDLRAMYSMNPYQGCEHGCIYCYARNTHQYWGYSAGLDFERKIIIKKNAAQLLEKELMAKSWVPAPVMLSGNTDCYQPAERRFKLTRAMLEVLLRFKNPVSIISKNNLILRDTDLLQELARYGLVHVAISITTLDESLRLRLEPRTVTGRGRLKVIEALTLAGVPCMVMNAPIIPGLNADEPPRILAAAADAGALTAGMTMVRLNGAVAELFTDWVYKNYPERADKVLKLIRSCHGGTLNDSRFGLRMLGEGEVAESIVSLFKISLHKYFAGRQMPAYNLSLFNRPATGQTTLFD